MDERISVGLEARGVHVSTPDLTRKRADAGRIGGLTTASRHDARELTKPATAGFLARFEREVDPDGVLPREERQRRALAARRAHMRRLAMRSAAVRQSERRK